MKNFIKSPLVVLAMMVLASQAQSGQLQLTWTDNSTNEDGFKIERKTGTTGSYAEIATVGANVTSYTNTALVDGSTYCFQVRAYNAAGNSPFAPEACGTVAATVQNFTLTVAKAGTGSGTVTATGINCGTDCTEIFSGSRQLTAAASAGSIFAGWSGGGCSGTAATCTVNLTANTTVTATFSTQPVQTFTLTVAKAGTGSGTVTATGINCGTDCTEIFSGSRQLTAAAGAGSIFAGWSGGGCSGTAATCTVNLTANTTVTATFSTQPVQTFTLTVAKSGTGSGTVTATGIDCGADCSEVLSSGSSRQLTALADAGSTFSGWSGGGCSGTGSCTVTLSANTTVTASFSTAKQQSISNQDWRIPAKHRRMVPGPQWQWQVGRFGGRSCYLISPSRRRSSHRLELRRRPAVSEPSTPHLGTWKLDTNGNDQWDDEEDSLVNSYGKIGDWPVIRKIAGIGSIIGTFTPMSVTRINGRRSINRGLWNFDVNGNSTMDSCSVDECDTFRSSSDNYSAERPVIGDWNGTGSENIGLFVKGSWYLDLNGNEKWDGSSGGDSRLTFGRSGDLPVVGDWDGTGKTDIGVFRPSTGEWFLD